MKIDPSTFPSTLGQDVINPVTNRKVERMRLISYCVKTWHPFISIWLAMGQGKSNYSHSSFENSFSD